MDTQKFRQDLREGFDEKLAEFRKMQHRAQLETARHYRSAYRAIGGVAFLATALFVLLPLQAVINVFSSKSTFIPRMLYGGLRKLFGYTVEFNKASAPIEQNKQTWYVANHMSPADFVVLGKALKGSFVAAGWLTGMSVVNAVGKAGRVLFVSQKKEDKFKQQDRGKIVQAFNSGRNVAMFPEGWTNDGGSVELFRAGLISLLFGDAATDKKGNPVTLEKDIVVQPIAIRVKSVDGEDAFAEPELREHYSMHDNKNTLSRIWKRLGYKNITLELTAFESMAPKDYKDAKEMMNEAHRRIVSVVAPEQKTVTKAPIEATEGERKTERAIDPAPNIPA